MTSPDSPSTSSQLSFFVRQTEDAASVCYEFLSSIPHAATRITAVISELFAVSSALRTLHHAEGTRQGGRSFHRIRRDLSLGFRTLRLTLDQLFLIFGRSRDSSYQAVWDDANDYFQDVEKFDLLVRLEWYKEFLTELHEKLKGNPSDELDELRQNLEDVMQAQEATLRRQRRRASGSGASTPRPRPRRASRSGYPLSPTASSGDHEWDRPPHIGAAPEAPTSPIFSDSSHDMSSSQTSYSDNPPFSPQPGRHFHWAQNIFDGRHSCTEYYRAYRSSSPCVCHGEFEPLALQHLVRDDFHLVLELPFDQNRFVVRLYWRPTDARARILVTAIDSYGRQVHFCQPLNRLKLSREASALELCRLAHPGHCIPWARLEFIYHERMVLFASTFIAMKRQDTRPIPHPHLVDELVLMGEHDGEALLFSGHIQHGNMCHALRLFHDLASGTVRLEASPARGSKQHVPIWSAFVTRWANDPDWAELRGNVVSLAVIRPKPYVFLLRYEPPRVGTEGYLLPFTTTSDARFFMAEWTALCRRNN